MTAEKKAKKKISIDQQYFKEARSWDIQYSERAKKSEKTAWIVAIAAGLTTLAMAFSISIIMPLKTIEPYVVSVDKSTGIVDVISKLDLSSNVINESTQEVIDKYWINKYLINRESYSWNSLESARQTVGILSTAAVQAEYDRYNNPDINPKAPVSLYGYDIAANIAIKSLSFIKSEIIDGTERKTALIRIVKTENKGSYVASSNWQVTLTFSYFNIPTEQSIRYLNPLGFQVLYYRVDPESME